MKTKENLRENNNLTIGDAVRTKVPDGVAFLRKYANFLTPLNFLVVNSIEHGTQTGAVGNNVA